MSNHETRAILLILLKKRQNKKDLITVSKYLYIRFGLKGTRGGRGRREGGSQRAIVSRKN